MPLKTPSFWRENTGLSRLLLPLSALYGLAQNFFVGCAQPYKSRVPVLCIGGVVAGGSGKTPTVQAVMTLIRERNLFQHPVILLRGYGGVLKGPVIVDPSRHAYSDVGDEALLHAASAQTIVSRDRAAGARFAEAMGADIIVMDDGLQNASLVKTWSFLTIDAAQGIGNGRLIPAGPLREPLSKALGKCQGVISLNGSCPFPSTLPVSMVSIRPRNALSKTVPYFAFAGLGFPEKFRLTLLSNQYILSGFKSFSDHHPFTNEDMETLLKEANGAPLLTTEKDMLRIPESYRDRVLSFPVRAVFDDPDAFLSMWMPS